MIESRHLKRLLFGHAGYYDHAIWEVESDASDDLTFAHFVSLHESLHAELDRTTDFGALLSVMAFYVSASNDEHAHNVLFSLTRSARVTHEVYATYLATLHFDPTTWEIQQLLNGLGDYDTYLKIGRRISAGVRGRMLPFLAATTVLRASMQAPVSERVLGIGVPTLEFRDLPFTLQPDARLRIIERFLSERPDYWVEAFGAIERQGGFEPDWKLLHQSEADETMFRQALPDDQSKFSMHLQSSLHEQLTRGIESLGLPSLGHEGHSAFTQRMIECVEGALGDKLPRNFRLQVARSLAPELRHRINFADERALFRSPGLDAKVTRLSEFSREQWKEMMSTAAGVEHYYLNIQRGARLADQFVIATEAERNLLTGTAIAACCVQWVVESEDGTRFVRLALIETPQQLAEFAEAVNDIAPLVASLSVAVTNDMSLTPPWREAIGAHTEPIILFDASPFEHVITIAQRAPAPTRYVVFPPSKPDRPLSSFMLLVGEGNNMTLYLILCSSPCAAAIEDYLKALQVSDKAQFAREDVPDQGIATFMNIVSVHRYGEERYSDFKAF